METNLKPIRRSNLSDFNSCRVPITWLCSSGLKIKLAYNLKVENILTPVLNGPIQSTSLLKLDQPFPLILDTPWMVFSLKPIYFIGFCPQLILQFCQNRTKNIEVADIFAIPIPVVQDFSKVNIIYYTWHLVYCIYPFPSIYIGSWLTKSFCQKYVRFFFFSRSFLQKKNQWGPSLPGNGANYAAGTWVITVR